VPGLAPAAGLVAAASLSFAPTPGALLGGGTIGPALTADQADVGFTTIRVSQDGKRLHFYGDWPARCGDGHVVTANIDRVVSLQADGSFVAAGLMNSSTVVGSFELRGRLDRRSIGGQELDVAAGSGSAELSSRRGSATSCKTPLLSWQVRSTPRVGGAPTPRKGAAYFGSDDQTDPVVLRVSRDGRSIVQAGIEFGLDCKHKRFLFASDVVPGARIGSDGRFAKVQRYASPVKDARFPTGSIARFTATLSGRFGASTVAGSLKVDVRIESAGAALVDTCHSETTFAASL
jgi:hypothetical protein